MKHAATKITGAALLVFSALFSARGQTNPNPNPTIDASIVNVMNSEHFPGLAAVVVKDDKIVWINSYGLADVGNSIPVSDTTVFMLASVSKVFTGTAVMQLAENNVIQLNDDVNSFLPWTLQIPGFPTNPVTFRQLMTHSSSIRDHWPVMNTYYDYPDPSITLAEGMQRYFSTSGIDYDPDDNFLPNPPGSVFQYSNMATALNGYLVETAAAMPFDEYCNENIFSKLCMDKTSWFFADLDSAEVARPYQYSGGNYIPYAHYGFADYPDGQLRSSVIDLANFMIAYLNGGEFGSSSLLSPASIDEMWTPQIPELQAEQGLNWYQEYLIHSGGISWVWGHSGGSNGVATEMYLDPVNKIGICVLANGEGSGLGICDELYDYALTLNSSTGISPECLTVTDIDEVSPTKRDKKLIKVVDLLGRETRGKTNTPLIKIYSDGSTEKVFILE